MSVVNLSKALQVHPAIVAVVPLLVPHLARLGPAKYVANSVLQHELVR